MRRALAIALTAGAVAAPSLALAEPAVHHHAHTRLLPHTVLDRVLVRMGKEAKHRRAERRAERRRAHEAAAGNVAIPPALQAIAACESGGDPHAIGGGGLYRGAFQMTYGAWASVGGTGDPAAAPMGEQVRRAALLYAKAGPGQWPVCGQ
jgi:Transglycosylase-like domain